MCSTSSCGKTGCWAPTVDVHSGSAALFAKDFDVANTVATDSGVVLPLGAAGQQLARQLRIEAETTPTHRCGRRDRAVVVGRLPP